ncbi:MAG: sigma factor-like helix-turn-helix DNA-binding protein [Bacillota bacterium]|nr:sigma factor-like helix-turn-helix DNA-binding protein [Bacillota bacterium]
MQLAEEAEVEGLIAQALSPYEREVVLCYLQGMSCREIAEACGTHLKSIANALRRVKCKLR